MLLPQEIEFIENHKSKDPRRLALDAKKFPDLDIPKLITQIQARQKLVDKLPSWVENPGIYFPQQISLEQSSSEIAANYKASLVSGNLIDLSGGMGVDTAAFSKTCTRVTYVEKQAILAEQTAYNHGQLGLQNITHKQGDGLSHLESNVDWVYVDPARRDEAGNKVILFKDCQPNVLDIIPFMASHANLLVKTSPILDITRALKELSGVHKVIIVCVKQEVKELLFLRTQENSMDPTIDIVDLSVSTNPLFSGKLSDEHAADMNFSSIGSYVYEAHPGLMKAGFFKLIQSEALGQLAMHTHVYTSEDYVVNFPGKSFAVVAHGPVQRNWLAEHLPKNQVNIATRNFPISPEDLRKKLKVKDGGDLMLFGIQNKAGKSELILCKKIG